MLPAFKATVSIFGTSQPGGMKELHGHPLMLPLPRPPDGEKEHEGQARRDQLQLSRHDPQVLALVGMGRGLALPAPAACVCKNTHREGTWVHPFEKVYLQLMICNSLESNFRK